MELSPMASWALVAAVLTLIGYACLVLKEYAQNRDAVLYDFDNEPELHSLEDHIDAKEFDQIEYRVLLDFWKHQNIQHRRGISDRPYDHEHDGL